jgi:peptidoglycan/xylan/chitin deacetylase (PgdA/CDA1 family)
VLAAALSLLAGLGLAGCSGTTRHAAAAATPPDEQPAPMDEPASPASPPSAARPPAGQLWLSFDDGPDPRWTPEILQILADNHVAATFCLVGRQVAAHPQLVSAEHRAGQQECNHSWDHSPAIRTMNRAAIAKELKPASDAITAATGIAPRYFRAPYGYWTKADRAEARAEGKRRRRP